MCDFLETCREVGSMCSQIDNGGIKPECYALAKALPNLRQDRRYRCHWCEALQDPTKHDGAWILSPTDERYKPICPYCED